MSSVMISLKAFLILLFITGVYYPLIVTGIGSVVWKEKSNGSLVYKNGVLIGSELLQQDFKLPRYFHGRPQELSNLSPKSEKQLKLIEERKQQGLTQERVYASGSGLDPEISLQAAQDQVRRISAERKIDPKTIEAIIQRYAVPAAPSVFSAQRVNVLKLNLALDRELK